MLPEIMLTANIRNELGTNNSKRLRKIKKQIPAIIYIKKEKSLPIYLDHNKIFCILKNKQNYKTFFKIEIEKNIYLVKIKNIQYHQYKPIILHMDFQPI